MGVPPTTSSRFPFGTTRTSAGSSERGVLCPKAETADMYRGIGAGANEYVTELFDQQTLLAKMRRIGTV